MINVVCGIRSTGRICTDLAGKLEKEGHTVMIAYGREFLPPEYAGYSYRIASDYEVRLDALKSRLFDNAGFNNVRATKTNFKVRKMLFIVSPAQVLICNKILIRY